MDDILGTRTVGNFLKSAGIGAAVGAASFAVGGPAGKAAGPILQRVVPKIASKIAGSGVGKAAAGKVPAAVRRLRPAKCSFVPRTQVLMADGTSKPIDKLKVGDKVQATDHNSGKTSPQPVLTTYSNLGI
jgi:hypothetical protein